MKKLLSLAFLVFLLLAQPVQAGLIWYSNFDQNTGTTVTPNIGTQTCAFTNSPTWVTGKFNFGIDFDAGTVDYLDCGTTSILSTDNWTIAAWIKLEASATFRNVINIGDDDGAAVSGVVFNVKDGDTLACKTYTGTNVSNIATSSASIDETGNVWTHVACRKSGTAITIWINGVQDGSATAASSTMDYTGDLVKFRIGAENTDEAPFLGQTDEVRVYDSVEDPPVIFAINPMRRPMAPIFFQ